MACTINPYSGTNKVVSGRLLSHTGNVSVCHQDSQCELTNKPARASNTFMLAAVAPADASLRWCYEAKVGDRCNTRLDQAYEKSCPSLHVACSTNRAGSGYATSGCGDTDGATRPWLMCKQAGHSYFLTPFSYLGDAISSAKHRTMSTTCERAIIGPSAQYGTHGRPVFDDDVVKWRS